MVYTVVHKKCGSLYLTATLANKIILTDFNNFSIVLITTKYSMHAFLVKLSTSF